MKILKESILISWKKEKKCTGKGHGEYGCGALLELEANDIFLEFQEKSYWSVADEDFNSYIAHSYNFKCPCCQKKTSIDEKEIPKNVRNAILSSEKTKKDKQKYFKKIGYR
ncbi:MAG: hypothetical protein HFE81_01355 [Bacilli bacterium]|nr:hypothetical protein [Bacilli bacterium]